jgi:2-dehydro-3-deoxygalactonokinase
VVVTAIYCKWDCKPKTARYSVNISTNETAQAKTTRAMPLTYATRAPTDVPRRKATQKTHTQNTIIGPKIALKFPTFSTIGNLPLHTDIQFAITLTSKSTTFDCYGRKHVTTNWIAVDWGTSSLRAWAIDAHGQTHATAHSSKGMGTLTPDAFEAALLDLITPWLEANTTQKPMQVIACGMVGARQGWTEALYAGVPCLPISATLTKAPTKDPRIEVLIVPGLSQNTPADVMRGEETQIAGFQAEFPKFDGIICLPGTHTKWAHVSAGEVVSFQSFMTGEIFALLSSHSVLKHSLRDGTWDDAAFDEALADALSRPEKLAAKLFSLRAEDLLHGLDGGAAKARLSGLLIGAELAAAKPYWLGQMVALIGADGLTDLYASALKTQGIIAQRTDPTDMTLAGLKSARASILE